MAKARKKHEKEQSKKARDGTNDRVSRAKAIEIDALYENAHMEVALPDTPSPRPTRRRIRLANPSCTDFGPLRHSQYNRPIAKWFFCGECDAWDNDKDIELSAKQTSRRYKCTAGHTRWAHPTALLPTKSARLGVQYTNMKAPKAVRRINFDESDDSDNEGVDFGVPPEVVPVQGDFTSCTLQQLVSIVESQQIDLAGLRAGKVDFQSQILKLKAQNIYLKRRVRCLEITSEPERSTRDDSIPLSPAVKSGRKDIHSENGRFQEDATRVLNNLVATRKWGKERMGKELATLVFEYSEDLCLEALITKAKQWLRKNVYTCYNILREMDRAGGTLGYEGIEILRAAETKRVKRYPNSVIPSTAEFKRAAEKVERLAHCLAPFVLGLTDAGDKEAIDFQPYWKIMGTVFRAYGLIGIGQAYSCLCVYSLDGASITKNLGHVLGGFKVADPSAICPMTGDHLLQNPTEMNAQSRNLCFPLKMIMGKETKETIKEFAPMFKFMEDCESNDPLLNKMMANYGMMPLTCAANCDLSAGWKCLCKGGAAKVANLPCHCCALYKDKWARPNSDTMKLDCNLCRDLHAEDPTWRCYHHSMMTPENLSRAQLELNRLTAGLSGSIETVDRESRLQRDDVEEAVPESDRNPASIHFHPETAEEKLKFGELLSAELILRGMSPVGRLSTKVETLLKAVRAEAKIRLLLTELEHGSPSEGAMFLLIQAIPCILHMENRVGIKILTMLMIEGLSNAKRKVLYTDIQAEGPRVAHFFRRIAAIVNKQVLGTNENSAEWECATDDKKKEIGTITMDNVRTRAIMARLELLIEECIVDEEDKAKWLACIPKFRDGLVKLRSKEDFDGDAVSAFQKDIDEFYQLWVELWGLEGVTNYIHMMSSGHLSTYLFKWKNLYRHSQQGWEAFNSLVKTFYFRRTQHGGRSNAGRGRKTRLLPIGRWLQRRVIWLCGFDGAYIESWNEENPAARRSGEQMNANGEEVEEEEDIYAGGDGYI